LSSDGNEFRGLLNETTAIEKEKLEIPGTPPAAEGIGIFDQREKISACQFGKLRAQLKNERVIINDFGTPMEIAINQSGPGLGAAAGEKVKNDSVIITMLCRVADRDS
jgi:hypothetical protein